MDILPGIYDDCIVFCQQVLRGHTPFVYTSNILWDNKGCCPVVWSIIIAFAISSSIDNFGIGITYGVRNIQIRLGANTLMAVICFLMSMGGITFGIWFSTILPGMFPVIFGAFLLVVIGIRVILLAKPANRESKSNQTLESKGMTGILKNPELADVNASGHIGLWEAVFLGVALSANSLTNGLGAGLLGLSPFTISLTAAIGSFISIWAGVTFGRKVAGVRIGRFTVGQFGTLLSGVLILVIAVVALLTIIH